jgi:membrane protease YdiL (CAAX protease family)
VITKEPSQHVTPISEEPTGFPEPVVRDALTPPTATMPDPWAQWFEVLKAFVVWVASVIMLIFVPAVVALPYIVYQWSTYGPPQPDALMSDKTLIFLSIIGILPTHLLTLGVIWLFVTEGGRRPFLQTLGFHWPKNISPGVGTLLCFLLALVLLGIGYAVTTVWGGSKTQLDLIVESSMAARVAIALVAFATAPLVEELVYRGVLYSALDRAAGKAIAVVVVSLLFAGVHVIQYANNVGVIVVITILSFTLTLARAYTGSVVPPFVIHLVFNGIQSLFILLAPFIDKSLLEKTDEITPTAPGLELAARLLETISVHVCRMT